MSRVYPQTIKPPCSIPDCNKPVHGRGWCKMHHRRWLTHGDPTIVHKTTNGTLLRWLREQIATRDRSEGCWEWPFAISKRDGYGRVYFDGSSRNAHHVALLLTTPQPIGSDHALHSCDNPACVNPSHLRWGTPQDNMTDKVSRNRQLRGEQHRMARLTEENVRAIRTDSRPLRIIAAEYGVTESHVCRIRNRVQWRHLP